ncbi:MAG: EF-P lysine aminoacylase GenX [Bdellovibrio sp.]|nr:EF-P lysine aminoacylase GenX [Bdellovibrio sp.]
MSKTRDQYLQNDWTQYPEMPRGALRWGRVEQTRLGVQNLTEWKFKDHQTTKAGDVLIDGDLVAIMGGSQLILLAPNLTSRGVRSEAWPEQKKWFEFLTNLRKFFGEKRFQEVKTPTLVTCPGTEPSLDVFETMCEIGSAKQKFYLPTSPELNLKKILVEGAERIFEIAAVFRNGEKTERHEPEFTMLEWYRAFANLSAIKMDIIELIEQMADQMKVDRPLEVLTFTMPDLFKKYCNFDFKPTTTAAELKQLAEKLNVDVKSANSIDDYFYLIFMDKIENQWPQDRLVFVEKYPPYQAALARVGADGWAERFEVYWKGLELGNAFHELNNPNLQKSRAIEDLEKKKALGKKAIELDEKFFAALDYGLPPSAGIAVGVERLYMALANIKDIKSLKKTF